MFEDSIYFKVKTKELQKKYIDMGSTQFIYTRKDKKKPVVIKNWWLVLEELLDDREEFVILAEEILDQND
ncbi:MAG: hypothetical protein ACI9GH_000179 [Candidatus Paceibacteria bacterium]|jgi:hypothetical protein